jgi:hypothetical protein
MEKKRVSRKDDDEKELKLHDPFIGLKEGHQKLAEQVTLLTRAWKSKTDLAIYQQSIQYLIDKYMAVIFPDVVKGMKIDSRYLQEFMRFFADLDISAPIPNVHQYPICQSIQMHLLNFIQMTAVEHIVEVGAGKGIWVPFLHSSFNASYVDHLPKLKQVTDEKTILLAVTPVDPVVLGYYQGNHLVVIGDEIKSDRMKIWELDKVFVHQTKYGTIRHYEKLAEVPYHLLSKRGKKLYRQRRREEEAEKRKDKQREKQKAKA